MAAGNIARSKNSTQNPTNQILHLHSITYTEHIFFFGGLDRGAHLSVPGAYNEQHVIRRLPWEL